MKRWTVAISVSAIVLLATFGAIQIYKYEARENFRKGVSAFKSGDYDEALIYLLPYARRNDLLAAELVGDLYAYGLTGAINRERAMYWYGFSSDPMARGHHECFVALAHMKGTFASPSRDEHDFWIKTAAQINDTIAERGCEVVTGEPTS